MACDLETLSTGQVVCGVETKIACKEAISLFQHMDSKNDPFIVVTAGKTKDGIVMGEVMADYLRHQGIPDQKILVWPAHTFNTDGEVQSLAAYTLCYRSVEEIIICVKWWHAPRTWALAKFRFHQARVQGVKLKIAWCRSEVGPRAVLQEFFGAIPLNIVRMVREKIEVRFFHRLPWIHLYFSE